jgi:hypothetical protein
MSNYISSQIMTLRSRCVHTYRVGASLGWLGLSVIGLILSTAPLDAQTSAAQPLADYAPLAPFAATDTGRNVTGYFAHGPESTAATCLAAVQLARVELERSPYQDTLAPATRLALDTLSSAARAVGAQCRQAFTTQSVPARDLSNLFTLALQLGDSSFATATAARWVKSPQIQPTDREETPFTTQCKRLSTIIKLYLNRDTSNLSFPATLASIQPWMSQLDALGTPAQRWALQAHADIILAQWKQMSLMGQWTPDHTIPTILDFLMKTDAVNSAQRPKMGTILTLLEALLQARGFVDPHGITAFYDSLSANSQTVIASYKLGGGQLDRVMRGLFVTPFTLTGNAVTPVSGALSYHAPGLVNANNTWPNPGRVSLLVIFANELGIDRAATLRRLATQYGAQGLSITLLTKTRGYWLKSGTHTGPVSPAQEAAEDSAYYLGYLHLPVTLMVDSTTFKRDTEGRLFQGAPAPFESVYGSKLGMVVLADRTGHVVVQDVVRDEARLTAYVRKALGQ